MYRCGHGVSMGQEKQIRSQCCLCEHSAWPGPWAPWAELLLQTGFQHGREELLLCRLVRQVVANCIFGGRMTILY